MLRALAAKAASAQRGVAPAGPQTQAERVSLKHAIKAAVDYREPKCPLTWALSDILIAIRQL